jgi:integrase
VPARYQEVIMLGRQAKVVSPGTLKRMLMYAQTTNQPARDVVMVLLSVKAGLRACEIAGLEWSMVTNDRGAIGTEINIRSSIAKRGSGRRVPMHPTLRSALLRLGREHQGQRFVIESARGGRLQANSVVNWFVAMFAELDVVGCSSHSGRRTFITLAAKNVHRTGGSLRDVQVLAGHKSIEMTQRYIDGDSASQRRLVRMI